jgi:antitoxin ParD1/3/4
METLAMSTTTTINISMPEKFRDAMKKRMAESGFENASEYVRYLIREDHKRAAEERLDALLLEGEQSGDPIRVDAQWKAKKKADLIARARKAKIA